jgi:hypothetical protein
MDAVIRQVIDSDEYDQLPVGIQLTYSRNEYLWLSDWEKATLLQRETEPDFEL